MSTVVAIGVLVVAAWLLAAAAAKIVDPAGSRAALAALGLSPSRAVSLAPAVPLVEVGVAVVIVVAPGAWPAQVALVALFTVFAVAGATSLLRGERTGCACFGAMTREATLGWRQILQLAPVLALALLLGRVGAPWDSVAGIVALGGSLLLATALHLSASVRTWRSVRADRISLMQARIANKRMASGVFDV